MDVIALTETSEKEDVGFLSNIEFDEYMNYHTPSKSSKGCTTIYVNKDFDSLERSDLDINVIEFESTWIEIKNKSNKNIIIGC